MESCISCAGACGGLISNPAPGTRNLLGLVFASQIQAHRPPAKENFAGPIPGPSAAGYLYVVIKPVRTIEMGVDDSSCH